MILKSGEVSGDWQEGTVGDDNGGGKGDRNESY